MKLTPPPLQDCTYHHSAARKPHGNGRRCSADAHDWPTLCLLCAPMLSSWSSRTSNPSLICNLSVGCCSGFNTLPVICHPVPSGVRAPHSRPGERALGLRGPRAPETEATALPDKRTRTHEARPASLPNTRKRHGASETRRS